MVPIQNMINPEELVDTIGTELEESILDLITLPQSVPLATSGDESTTQLAIITAILALDPALNLDPAPPPADIDPTSALRAYLSSPELSLFVGDLDEAEMHEFDDRVRRGLDPITREYGVAARLKICVLGAVTVIDTMVHGLLKLRSMLTASVQGIKA
ncbi:hypothetical protein BC937DRAFT_89563 [Endogone sp. FLAS-F59071]|nr:hypothetical protein BC937DRAFT_89563 [Endogone sp. FLAS-F59071]|eukprot:RUS17730.1 hypothetical protein BC937DRAFT_89563 [Endogone sp. FLAS-F59071]